MSPRKQQRSRIVLDFDDTCYRTAELISAMQDLVVAHGGTREQCSAARAAVSKPFVFHRYALHIKAANPAFRLREFERAVSVYLDKKGKSLVYPDVLPFLRAHRGSELIILTYGHRSWQLRKVASSGLLDMVDRCVVTIGSKAEARGIFVGEGITFVDDNATHLEAVKRHHPHVHVVQMQRPDAHHRDEAHHVVDAVVASLGKV